MKPLEQKSKSLRAIPSYATSRPTIYARELYRYLAQIHQYDSSPRKLLPYLMLIALRAIPSYATSRPTIYAREHYQYL